MKSVALHTMKYGLSKMLRMAEHEDIVITRHGKAAGVLRGFSSEDDLYEYQLLNDPEFQKSVKRARDQFKQGKGVPIEEARKRFHL